jgi:hypothetical protein
MCTTMKATWLKAETVEMDGLIKRHVWNRVLRSTLTAQDQVFSTRFYYKNKRLNGELDKYKVRLVVQGQHWHMHRRDADGKGDYDDAVSPVPHASGFCTILSLATASDMHLASVDISQAFVQGELLPVLGDGYSLHLAMMRILCMYIFFVNLSMACPVPLARGTPLLAPF